MNQPTIKVFKKSLPKDMIDRMLSITNYNPSEGYDFATNTSKPTSHRTSSTFFDFNSEFKDIRDYVLNIIKEEAGDQYRPAQCELFQLQKYDSNQFFKPHWDFFNVPGYEKTTDNDRIATAILYLKTATKGGTTNFPNLNLNIECEVGDIVYFTYRKDEDKIKTLHEGANIEEGQKIIATLWIREEDFK